MSQFNFYGSQDDWWPLLTDLLKDPEVGLILDRAYGAGAPPFLSALDKDTRTAIKKLPRIFIHIGPRTAQGVSTWKVKEGKVAGTFWVSLDHSPSCLSLTLPACFVREGKPHLNVGALFRPSQYWNEREQIHRTAGPEVQAAFERIKRLIKGGLKTVTLGTSRVQVGTGALELLVHKGARILVRGKWLTSKKAGI